tara:strand:+ start:392 stop:628 length:237 start_codon:yes stop_codon:yes gene_type:complete
LAAYPGGRNSLVLLEISMDIKQAIQIIEDKRAMYGMSLLDMVIVMNELSDNDELDNREAVALRVFMQDMRKLFAPVGA